MRTFGITTAIVIGCGIVLASCSDDNSSRPSNEGGAGRGIGGYAGSSTGGSINAAGNHASSFAGASIGGLPNSGTQSSGAAGAPIGGSAAAVGGFDASAGRANGGLESTGGINNAGTSNGGNLNSAGVSAAGGYVPCTPTNDTCPNGQYCVSTGVCVAGCKTGSNCTSGVCLPDHSCQSCISDAECASGKLCGTGTCSAPCTITNSGTAGGPATSTCSGGLSCCDSRCVDTTVDSKNCLGCGVSCQVGEFCGTSGCAPAKIENLCDVSRVTGVLVENVDDAVDDAQTTALVNAFSECNPVPSATLSGQSTGSVVNRTTGQPVSRGALLAVAGGPYFQHLVNYLADQALLPVYDVWDWTNNTVTVLSRRDSSELRKIDFAEMSSTRDLIIVEVAVDPVTGTPILVAFGTDEGTPAAAWYFAQFAMTDTTAAAKTWFVCDWTDQGTVGPDAADLWNCISG